MASTALPQKAEAATPATGDGFDVVFTTIKDLDDEFLQESL